MKVLRTPDIEFPTHFDQHFVFVLNAAVVSFNSGHLLRFAGPFFPSQNDASIANNESGTNNFLKSKNIFGIGDSSYQGCSNIIAAPGSASEVSRNDPAMAAVIHELHHERVFVENFFSRLRSWAIVGPGRFRGCQQSHAAVAFLCAALSELKNRYQPMRVEHAIVNL